MNLIQNIFDFFLILSFVNLFVICDDIPSPSPRDSLASSLVNNKLYFFGGIGSELTNEVWYLDLSNSFNVSVPPWHKDKELPVAIAFASSCVSPIDNSLVFLIGGNMSHADNTSVPFYPTEVFIFDSKISHWRPPNIIDYNTSFTGRFYFRAIIDNDGKIFMFGGRNPYINISDTYIANGFLNNDMHMLDTTTMKWSTLSISQNVPLPRFAYAAVLLPTAEIIYIGGHEDPQFSLVEIKMVRFFNTKSFTWSNKQTTGASIDSRGSHTAVLTQDGSIIIYGGMTINFTRVSPDLAVLNINTWEWSIPNIPQKDVPPSLARHSAAIYENYMIVSFGRHVSEPQPSTNPFIYILDIRNYTWVNVANINKLESTPIPTNLSSFKFTLIVVVASVASIILIGSVIAGIFIYKKRQERRHSIATPGSK
ncbi:galactose oxidase [Gigaspora margarita]|uniref:Galactose oxidase n=1 Tax=Gigaspora margarita TaxID=4874 RepID=A0A8H4EP10_GIGMA|nr:galactose oxidase [Gigaspora margarita]